MDSRNFRYPVAILVIENEQHGLCRKRGLGEGKQTTIQLVNLFFKIQLHKLASYSHHEHL